MRNNQTLRPPFLLNESVVETRYVSFVRSTLLLCSLQLNDDDEYACTASNNLSTVQEIFTLNIKGAYSSRHEYR